MSLFSSRSSVKQRLDRLVTSTLTFQPLLDTKIICQKRVRDICLCHSLLQGRVSEYLLP